MIIEALHTAYDLVRMCQMGSAFYLFSLHLNGPLVSFIISYFNLKCIKTLAKGDLKHQKKPSADGKQFLISNLNVSQLFV